MPAALANSQSSILERVVQSGHSSMTPAVAESFMQMKFSPRDVRRMGQLLALAQSDALTPDQAGELEDYRNVGRMLDLVQSQARRVIKRRGRK